MTAYSPEVHATIVAWISDGNYFETACTAAGVAPRTARDWLREGARAAREAEEAAALVERGVRVPGRLRGDQGRPWLAQFWRDVVEAEGKFEAKAVREWSEAGDWRATESLLERRFPRRWGRKINVTVEEELDAVLRALERGLEPKVFERVLAIIVGVTEDRADRDGER